MGNPKGTLIFSAKMEAVKAGDVVSQPPHNGILPPVPYWTALDQNDDLIPIIG